MKKMSISDYTLRMCAEGRRDALLFREKIALAKCAKSCGFDRIELGGVNNPKEDRIICRTIGEIVGDLCVCLNAGDTEEAVREAYSLLETMKAPCLQIVLPVSTVSMEYRYHVKIDKMLLKVRALVETARSLCEQVEFAAEDASRADTGELCEVIRAAAEAGATAVTICDTAGEWLPEDCAATVKAVKAAVDVPVYVQLSDRISLAVANALAAIAAGADGIKTTLYGKDTLSSDALATALYDKGDAFGITCDIRYTDIHKTLQTVRRTVETKIAAALENEGDPEQPLYLDADSTMSQVEHAIAGLGYELSEDDIGKVYEAMKLLCEKKESIGTKELELIIASNAMQAPSTYHLESFVTTTGNQIDAVAGVVLTKEGERINGSANGNGPIAALFLAIEQCAGSHYEVDDFQIQSVTEGKEAVAYAIVRLRDGNGKLYSGNGISTDIVAASARAYLNALNKIVYEL